MTKVAAIIPSFLEKDKDYLKLCVESLRASGFDGEVIVVTNGTKSNPGLDIKGITNRLHTRDQGQCNAVNIGASVANPNVEYLFVINSDMYFAPGWDKNLRFDYQVFSPNLIEPTDNAGSAPPFLKLDAGNDIENFDKFRVDDFVRQSYKIKTKQEPGFNLPFFIRKDVWNTIGGYDLKYDPWGSNSDTDLQTAINLAGITPMRLRDVLVYHFSNKSGTFDGTHQDAWQKNWDYFDQKWGFNRDTLGSDVWYNQDMLPKNFDDVKFKPDWTMKYADD